MQLQKETNVTQMSYFEAKTENDIAVVKSKFGISDVFKDIFADISIMEVIITIITRYENVYLNGRLV